MLCWQQPNMMIDKYTWGFKARVQMCEELKSNIDNNTELQNMLCDEEGVAYRDMLLASYTAKKDKLKQTQR